MTILCDVSYGELGDTMQEITKQSNSSYFIKEIENSEYFIQYSTEYNPGYSEILSNKNYLISPSHRGNLFRPTWPKGLNHAFWFWGHMKVRNPFLTKIWWSELSCIGWQGFVQFLTDSSDHQIFVRNGFFHMPSESKCIGQIFLAKSGEIYCPCGSD